MAHYRRHSMASALAIGMSLLSLSACGGGTGGIGGGGGGGGGVFTPPPPPPGPGVGPAAAATIPNGNLLPVATVDGPTIKEHATTDFPLLQTVVKMSFDETASVSARTLVADVATMAGGATLGFEASGGTSSDHSFSVPALDILGVDLNWVAGGFYCYYYYSCSQVLIANVGEKSMVVDMAAADDSDLSWTTYGTWSVVDDATGMATQGAFVTGYKTADSAVPNTGTAIYNGTTVGRVYSAIPVPTIGSVDLTGDVTLQANFGTGNIAGSMTNMQVGGVAPWNSVSLVGAISGGVNYFSGTTATASTPAGFWSMNGSATGTFAGMFFGPGAEELGAVWTLQDGSRTATGAFGAKAGP